MGGEGFEVCVVPVLFFWRGMISREKRKKADDTRRSEDLNMAAVFNSRERTLREWRALFAEADSRFVFKSVRKPEGSALAVMEVVWTPS